jgi:hypothetical protein
MDELRAILARYQRGSATLGQANDEGPIAPRLGRDLEVGLARIRRRALVSYGAAGTFVAALLGAFATAPGKQPLFVVALMAGTAVTVDYLRRVSHERDGMDLVLGLCQSADDPVIAAVIAGTHRPTRRASASRPVLLFEDVERLHDAAIRLNLGQSRGALFGGVDRAILSSLPVYASPSAQILSDIHELNRLGRSSGGDAPLGYWLRNARSLAGPQREAATIERCLALLEAAPVSVAGAQS